MRVKIRRENSYANDYPNPKIRSITVKVTQEQLDAFNKGGLTYEEAFPQLSEKEIHFMYCGCSANVYIKGML